MQLTIKFENPFKRRVDLSKIENPFESKDSLIIFLGKTMAAAVQGKIDVKVAENVVLMCGQWEKIQPFKDWSFGRAAQWSRPIQDAEKYTK